MSSAFSVDILTPSKIIGRNIKATSLIVPTSTGEINILPEHTHLIATLGIGHLKILNHEQSKVFFVANGILKVLKDKIVLLAEYVEKPEEINREKALQQKAAAQKAIDSGLTPTSERFKEECRNIEMADKRLGLINK